MTTAGSWAILVQRRVDDGREEGLDLVENDALEALEFLWVVFDEQIDEVDDIAVVHALVDQVGTWGRDT